MTRLRDWLLGPKCPHGCGQRLFPKDIERHQALDHAGDTRPGPTQGETA